MDSVTTPTPTQPRSGWIAIARLMRPQGRRGELLAESLSDLPEVFRTGQAARLTSVDAVEPPPASPTTEIEQHWFPTGKNAGRVVLKLSGCNTISDAEALAGRQLMVPVAALPALDEDTYLVGDLLGCVFFDEALQLGHIADVEFATGPDGRTRLPDAAPLLAIALDAQPEAEPMLVPFVRAWLLQVDIAGKRVIMRLPPGLLDNLEDPFDEPDRFERAGL